MEEAWKKISGIEAALAALAALASVGTNEGPEVQLLQESLKKTKRAAQESPIAVQVAESESYVDRARKRLEAHDATRAELVAELEAGQAQLPRLRAMAEKPIVPEASSELAMLRAKLAAVKEERDAALQARPAKKLATGHGVAPIATTTISNHPRLQEDFVPMCHEDIVRWMQDRQADIRDATMAGNAHGSGEIVPGHGIRSHGLVNSHSDAFHGVQYSPVIKVCRVIHHQCAFQGCRVGEASNPGPVQTRQARSLERSIPFTQVDVSSDEKDLVLPNRGRHVIPRTVGELLWQDCCQSTRSQPVPPNTIGGRRRHEGRMGSQRRRSQHRIRHLLLLAWQWLTCRQLSWMRWKKILESTDLATSGASPGVPVRNRFSVFESTVRETDCPMSTGGDGSGGDVEVFPMIDDAVGHVSREPIRRRPCRRRLVLIPQMQDTPRSIQDRQSEESDGGSTRRHFDSRNGVRREGGVAAVAPVGNLGVSGDESDRLLQETESVSSREFSTDIGGQSKISGTDEGESEVEPDPPSRMPGVATLRAAFLLLDHVNLAAEMEERASVMKSVPKFLRGPNRIAMRTALENICGGRRGQEWARQERGWKVFFLLPRMLLHRPARGGLIPRSKLESRFESFVRGDWRSLISASRTCNAQAASVRQRRSRRSQDCMERRAARAEALVRMGELSSARQALEGADLGPGTRHTLDMQRDESRRPRHPRVPIPPALANLQPQLGLSIGRRCVVPQSPVS